MNYYLKSTLDTLLEFHDEKDPMPKDNDDFHYELFNRLRNSVLKYNLFKVIWN